MTRDLGSHQRARWEHAFVERADRYGTKPSKPGRAALATFRRAGFVDLLELGAGQGRDTVYFARKGLNVTALDFAETAVHTVAAKTRVAPTDGRVTVLLHDVRKPLPLPDAAFDACYSHMLFCMALKQNELESLAAEIRRVLRPGGLCIYTARTTSDPDFGAGLHRCESIYELDGFAVHYFSHVLVQHLASGFELETTTEFEEGTLAAAPLSRHATQADHSGHAGVVVRPC